MTRVNVDSKSQRDPRFRILASLANRSLLEVRAMCLDVWFACYDARSPVMSRALVDAAADHPGFADSMVTAELAESTSDSHVRVRGVSRRIQYLVDIEKRARSGGFKSGEARRFKKSNPLTLAPDLVLSPDLAPAQRERDTRAVRASLRPRKGEIPEETQAQARTVLDSLGRYTGVEYRGAMEHYRLIAGRFAEGASVLDLRKVAWYCARVLKWGEDDKMAHFLRPETLYGPKTVSKYLDAARAAYRKQFGTDAEVAE